MTTMTTLNDVRAAMIARGYPAEEVDAMLDLTGRMILEGSLASKDDLNTLRDEFRDDLSRVRDELKHDVNGLRDEFRDDLSRVRDELKHDVNGLRDELTLFKIDVAERFAGLRAEMDTKFAELRAEMDAKFAELRAEMDTRFAQMDTKFAELRAEMDTKFAQMDAKIDAKFAQHNAEITEKINAADIAARDRHNSMLKWMAGLSLAAIGVNAGVIGIVLAVVSLA